MLACACAQAHAHVRTIISITHAWYLSLFGTRVHTQIRVGNRKKRKGKSIHGP